MNAAYENFCAEAGKEMSVAVFGAGKFAKTLAYFLDRKGIKTDAFVVTGHTGKSAGASEQTRHYTGTVQ